MPSENTSLATGKALGQKSRARLSWQIEVGCHLHAHNCLPQLHGLTVVLRGCNTGHTECLMQHAGFLGLPLQNGRFVVFG